MGEKRATVTRARGAVRRVRNALAEAGPALASLEELVDLPDNIGRYVLGDDEELNEADVLDFLRLARQQHPGGTIEIVVLGRSEDGTLSDVKGQQAEHAGGSDAADHAGRRRVA